MKAKETAAVAAAVSKRASRFSLDDLSLSQLATGAMPIEEGVPLQVSLSEIDEDPTQPRQMFDAEALEELAESIRQHGVKTPISLRSKNAEGRYLINYGARRFRASKLAQLEKIPAFIDDTHDAYAQVVENIQRDDLKPMELARFVGSELAKGKKQKEIAERLGKSKSWISKFAALASAPSFIAEAADKGVLTSHDAIYDLVTHLEKNGEDEPKARAFLDGKAAVTQQEVRGFLQVLKPARPAEEPPKVSSTKLADRDSGRSKPLLTPPPTPKLTDPLPPVVPNGEAEAEAEASMTEGGRAAEEKGGSEPAHSPNTPRVRAEWDQGQSARAEKPRPTVVSVSRPVLLFTKDGRRGTVNLAVSTDYGYLMVRYEGEHQDTQVRAGDIEVTALIEQ